IDTDRVDSRVVVAAAEPLGTLGPPPEALDQGPGLAAVLRAKQPAGNRAGPERALAAGLQAPDLDELPRCLLAVGLRRIGRHRDLLPALAAVRGAAQLDAEVAEVERGVEHAVAGVGQHHRDRVAEEMRPPRLARGIEDEQALAGRYQQSL